MRSSRRMDLRVVACPRLLEIPGGLLHDRGRGPEIRGTRITVYNLLPHLLDPTATEDYIARVNQLTPDQVASAQAYILNNPDTVLAEHLRIEQKIAAGNKSPGPRKSQPVSHHFFCGSKNGLPSARRNSNRRPKPRRQGTAAASALRLIPNISTMAHRDEESRPLKGS